MERNDSKSNKKRSIKRTLLVQKTVRFRLIPLYINQQRIGLTEEDKQVIKIGMKSKWNTKKLARNELISLHANMTVTICSEMIVCGIME